MARETNEVLGHGDEADGIEEYDNPLPDWWMGLFIITIVYGVVYAFSYHFIFEDSQHKRYLAEMQYAQLQWPAPDGPMPFEMDESLLADGEAVFAQTCASCHGAQLEGGIGPSLVDEEWVHGGSPDEIVATITKGVAAKGMPAWGPVLGPNKVRQVATYVVSKMGEVPPSDGSAATEGAAAVEAAEPVALDGAGIYAANCAACHGPELEGLVGPSLVDDEWIHGQDLEQIIATVTTGVPEKGMVSWGPILGEEKVELVARFVHDRSMEATD